MLRRNNGEAPLSRHCQIWKLRAQRSSLIWRSHIQPFLLCGLPLRRAELDRGLHNFKIRYVVRKRALSSDKAAEQEGTLTICDLQPNLAASTEGSEKLSPRMLLHGARFETAKQHWAAIYC